MSDDEIYGSPGFVRRIYEFADRMTSEKLREMSRDELAAIMREYEDFVRQAEIRLERELLERHDHPHDPRL